MAMLEHAWQQGVPMRWVAGDEVYGDATELRDRITARHRLYVLAIRPHTPIWAERPQVEDPAPLVLGLAPHLASYSDPMHNHPAMMSWRKRTVDLTKIDQCAIFVLVNK